jgi:hypothetical protein
MAAEFDKKMIKNGPSYLDPAHLDGKKAHFSSVGQACHGIDNGLTNS